MKLEEEMPSPIYLDLKPNRLLLDPKFDGYKLSLDKLSIYSTAFPYSVDRVGPSEEQYSIQHAKLFGLHNFLHGDPFNSHQAFVIDNNWVVYKVEFNAETTKFGDFKEVWKIPTGSSQIVGRFNAKISFPSDSIAVVGDGFGAIFVLETGDRKVLTDSWTIVHEETKVQEQTLEDIGQFVLLDSKLYEDDGVRFLDILFLGLKERTDAAIAEFLEKYEQPHEDMTKHPFVSKLNWVSLKQVNSKWTHNCTRTLLGPSAVDYAFIENNGTGLLVAGENHFSFFHISNEALKYKGAPRTTKGEPQKPDYVWMQAGNEITVLFKIPIGATKSDVIVDVQPSSIQVAYLSKMMLEGELQHSVKNEEVIWTLTPMNVTEEESQDDGDVTCAGGSRTTTKQYHSLEIILQKVLDNRWEGDSLVKGESSGQQVLDPELLANIQERLSHLCSDKWNDDPIRSKVCDPHQLEECDGFPVDTTSFMRIDRDGQCISHVASLGSHQWLFSARIHDSGIPAMCVRHDVDGLVWQPPVFDKLNFDAWKLEHIGTFSALGYVQASKQQRKFTVCAPDLSFVAICDTIKHVYVYKQPHEIGSDLRNRRTGQVLTHTSKQHVVSLDPAADILGAWATNEFLFILTTGNVYAIRVKEIVQDQEML